MFRRAVQLDYTPGNEYRFVLPIVYTQRIAVGPQRAYRAALCRPPLLIYVVALCAGRSPAQCLVHRVGRLQRASGGPGRVNAAGSGACSRDRVGVACGLGRQHRRAGRFGQRQGGCEPASVHERTPAMSQDADSAGLRRMKRSRRQRILHRKRQSTGMIASTIQKGRMCMRSFCTCQTTFRRSKTGRSRFAAVRHCSMYPHLDRFCLTAP